jgi:hypothetical protein
LLLQAEAEAKVVAVVAVVVDLGIYLLQFNQELIQQV